MTYTNRKNKNKEFLGLADMTKPPEGYEKYIWSCDGCVNGIRWCEEHGREYKVLPNKWLDETKVDETVAYLKGIRKKLISSLAKELNAYLNEDYGIEAWNTRLYAWLCMYLFTLYDKYLNLKCVIDNDIQADVLSYEFPHETVSIDNFHFSKRMQTDEYNLYQYSLLLGFMDVGCINKTNVNDRLHKQGHGSDGEEAAQDKKNIKIRIAEPMLRAMTKLGMILCRRNGLLIAPDAGVPCGLMLRCWLKTRGRVMPVAYSKEKVWETIKNISADDGWRAVPLKMPEGVDEFTAIAFRMAKQELPIVYAEGHARLKEYLDKECGSLRRISKLICGASSIRFDDFLNLLYTEIRNRGGYVCGIQHGGNYGIEKLWLYHDEIALADRFYTWGWTQDVYGDGSKPMRPMPCLKCIRTRYTDAQDNGGVLYITYSSGRYQVWAMRTEMQLGDRMREERRFLKSISSDIRKHMTVRLYPGDYGWETKEAIKEEITDVKFDSCESITDSINGHSLIIISDWQTTVNEALFSGKPFIFLRDTSFLVNDAVGDIEELHRAGAACYTWDELRARAEEIYPNYMAWWQEPARQNIVKKIKAKYAWRSDNAEKLWIEEIEDLCVNGA